MTEAKAEELWKLIEPFAAYGFNKAHAAFPHDLFVFIFSFSFKNKLGSFRDKACKPRVAGLANLTRETVGVGVTTFFKHKPHACIH